MTTSTATAGPRVRHTETFTRTALRAVLDFASTDLARVNLAAVNVYPGGGLMATNGHILACVWTDAGFPPDAWDKPIAMLGVDAAKHLCKIPRKNDSIRIEVLDYHRNTGGESGDAVRTWIESETAEPVLGPEAVHLSYTAPAVAQILANRGKTDPGPWLALDAKYLMQVARAASTINPIVVVSNQGELDPLIVEAENAETGHHFLAVLMPVRR